MQVAVVHCSAQTTATHVLQKLAQVRLNDMNTLHYLKCAHVCVFEGVYGDLH